MKFEKISLCHFDIGYNPHYYILVPLSECCVVATVTSKVDNVIERAKKQNRHEPIIHCNLFGVHGFECLSISSIINPFFYEEINYKELQDKTTALGTKFRKITDDIDKTIIKILLESFMASKNVSRRAKKEIKDRYLL